MMQFLFFLLLSLNTPVLAGGAGHDSEYRKVNEIEKAVSWLWRLKRTSPNVNRAQFSESFQKVIHISKDAQAIPTEHLAYVSIEKLESNLALYIDENRLKFAIIAPHTMIDPGRSIILNNIGIRVKESFETLFLKVVDANNYVGKTYGRIPLRLRLEDMAPDSVVIRQGHVLLTVDVDSEATPAMIEDLLLLIWNTVGKNYDYGEALYFQNDSCEKYLLR